MEVFSGWGTAKRHSNSQGRSIVADGGVERGVAEGAQDSVWAEYIWPVFWKLLQRWIVLWRAGLCYSPRKCAWVLRSYIFFWTATLIRFSAAALFGVGWFKGYPISSWSNVYLIRYTSFIHWDIECLRSILPCGIMWAVSKQRCATTGGNSGWAEIKFIGRGDAYDLIGAHWNC